MLLIAVTIVTFLIWRKRRHRIASTSAASPSSPTEARPDSNRSIQEIGHQSVQELHNNSPYVELPNGHAPSGSGLEINELPSRAETTQRRSLTMLRRDHRPTPVWDRILSSNKTRSIDHDTIPGTSIRRAIASNPASRTHPPQNQSKNENDRMDYPSARGIKVSSSASSHTNLNKELPRTPCAKEKSGTPSTPVKPIINDIQMQDWISVKAARSSTYATIFNIEEYNDRSTSGIQ